MIDDSIDYNRPIAEWTDVQLERFSKLQREYAEWAVRDHTLPEWSAVRAGVPGKLADEILRLRPLANEALTLRRLDKAMRKLPTRDTSVDPQD